MPHSVTMHAARVFLVGAGPGNAGLLTLRAAACLRRADLVLYDRLVAPALLAHAPKAQHVCVTELADHHSERYPKVNDLLLDAARQGKCVVRLKSGDPLVFGRGGEEAELLRAAGVPFEIVPGVTAALGAGAYSGIPLTDRRHASAVAFVTGHESDKEDSTLDWDALARFPGTLVFYMGVARLASIARSLIEHGKAADTPTAVICQATLGCQRTVTAPLAGLATAAAEAGVRAPAVTVVGPVVALREQVNWFEHLPLFGKGVLVTRPREQAVELLEQLEALGAIPYLQPTVEIRDAPDGTLVDNALSRLAAGSWLVFTSANGVHALLRRLRATGRDLRALGGVQLAAIGPATADALRGYHLDPDLVPLSYNSEALVDALRDRVRGQHVLLARADRGRDVLREELSRVARVEQVAVYSQVDVGVADPTVLDALRSSAISHVLLTSSNIARALAKLVDETVREHIRQGRVKLVTISAVTSADVRSLGWPVAAEAKCATVAGVVEALLSLAAGE